MIVSVMQPYFYPYIGYWQLMASSDVFVILDDVNYINRGWINRNRLLLNGEAKYFNIQLSGASQNKKINEINLTGDANAIAKQLQTIRTAYGKAPNFKEVFPVLEACYRYPEPNLAVFLKYSLETVRDYLGINTKIAVSSETPKDESLSGQQRILALCHAFQATEYHNPIGGLDLYDKALFREHGIDLFFVKSRPDIRYKQFEQPFVPWLSILDMMMFNTKKDIGKYLAEYDLI